MANDPNATVLGRVGWYQVEHLTNVEGGWILYHSGGSGVLDDAGFA